MTLGSGEAAGRGLQALALIWLTRALGPAAIGDFGLATAVTAYAVLVVAQGFDTIAIRSAVQGTRSIPEAAGKIIGLRLTLAALTFAVTIIGSTFAAQPVARLFLGFADSMPPMRSPRVGRFSRGSDFSRPPPQRSYLRAFSSAGPYCSCEDRKTS